MSRTGYSSTDPATNSEKRVLNFQINCIFLTKNPQRNLIYVQMKFFYLVKTSESNFCNWLVSKINILKSETFLVTWQIFIIVDDNFTTPKQYYHPKLLWFHPKITYKNIVHEHFFRNLLCNLLWYIPCKEMANFQLGMHVFAFDHKSWRQVWG